MNILIQTLIHQLETNPSVAVPAIQALLNVLGPSLVTAAASFLPAGTLKDYASAHPDEALAFVKEQLALIAKYPALAKAVAGQLGGKA